MTLITGGIYCDENSLSRKVKVIKLNRYRRNGIFNRILSWKIFAIGCSVMLLFAKGKVVLSSNPPFLFPLISALRFLFGKELYLIVYDLYPEALINFGYFGKNSSVVKIWRKLNRRLFQGSAAIFTISSSLANGVGSYLMPGDNSKIYNIPVWGDGHSINPVARTENLFIEKHSLSGYFVVQYSGNFGLTHDIEVILEAALKLRDDSDVRFLMIGEGAKQGLIKEYIDEHQLKNILLLPWQPVADLAYSLSSADLGVITLSKNAEAVSLPSKTFSYMKAGVALLAVAGENSELAKIVNKYDCGLVCYSGLDLAAAVIKLKNDKVLLDRMSENALKASDDFTSINAHKFYEVMGA